MFMAQLKLTVWVHSQTHTQFTVIKTCVPLCLCVNIKEQCLCVVIWTMSGMNLTCGCLFLSV